MHASEFVEELESNHAKYSTSLREYLLFDDPFQRDELEKAKVFAGEGSNDYLDDFLEVQGRYSWTVSFLARERLVKHYAWAVPTPAAINLLIRYSPLVEMGAGGGYWASLVQQKATPDTIIPYDIAPGKNHWVDKLWTEVVTGGPEVLKDHKDRALFLCWPPYSEPMAGNCLTHYEGEHVILIGEGNGGCCGDDTLYEMLDKQFESIETLNIPQWHGLHDYLEVFRRKPK